MVGQAQKIAHPTWFYELFSRTTRFLFFEKVEKFMECSVCMSTTWSAAEMRPSSVPWHQCAKNLISDPWDIGNFRFKGRQISQMPNEDSVFDMEQFKHELEQIEVSKADKTKPERNLNTRKHTHFWGGVGSLGWLVHHCCPQLSIGWTAPQTIITDSARFIAS